MNMQPTTSKSRDGTFYRPVSLIKICILLVIIGLQGTAISADLVREQRIDAQISEMILDGEPVYLKDGEHQFLTIHTRTEREPVRGAALILHGRGANPDWMDVIHPLRTRLPEYGWETLSIQLPIASEGANQAEWQATIGESLTRLSAALDFLEQRGIQNIVLISHSFGNFAAARFLGENKPQSVRAWVAIGMSLGDPSADIDMRTLLSAIQIPVLDLFGEDDLPDVLESRGTRYSTARDAGNEAYQQRKIPSADHFFTGQDELLINTVRAWLARVASGAGVR